MSPALIRLLHLVSPTLPVGAYTYSQGLEWVVETGVVKNEATALAWTEQVPVLLIAYDVPSPFPLSEHRPILAPFAVALRLNPAHTGPHLATVRFQRATNADPTALDHPVLEALRNGNPAARSLPLLCALARRQAQHLILPVGDHEWLGLAVAP